MMLYRIDVLMFVGVNVLTAVLMRYQQWRRTMDDGRRVLRSSRDWTLLCVLCCCVAGCSGNNTTTTSDMTSIRDMSSDLQDMPAVDMRADLSGDMPSTQDMPDMQSVDPLSLDVTKPGPFVVGYRKWEVTYTPVPGGEPRTILINLWYPASAPTSTIARYLNFFRDKESFVDAPLAPSIYADGKYPVHVYSHGDQGFGGTSAFMLRHMVSHGWVAVAPDHVGNTFNENIQPRPTELYAWRPLDVTQSLDALESLASDDPLAGKLDTSRVIMSGYSFGVFSTWAAVGATFQTDLVKQKCQDGTNGLCAPGYEEAFTKGFKDDRIVGGIVIAGSLARGWVGDDGHVSVDVPMMSISGSKDPVGADTQFDTIKNIPMTWLDIDGACHNAFGVGSCSGSFDARDAYPIVSAYALAFGRAHLLSDPGEAVRKILSGETTVDASVSLKTHQPE